MCIQYIDTPPRHKLQQGLTGPGVHLHRGKTLAQPSFLYFFSHLGDSQICSSKLLAFPEHLPAAVLSLAVLLLLTTSSPCPADLHGTRLSTKIKTQGPYFSQHQGAVPVGFTHMGGAGGGMSRSVLLSIQRQIGERFIYLLSPSPN